MICVRCKKDKPLAASLKIGTLCSKCFLDTRQIKKEEMNNQLKYAISYGHSVETKTVEVYAFDIEEAIKIANRVTSLTPGRKKITKVEQLSDLKEFTNE